MSFYKKIEHRFHYPLLLLLLFLLACLSELCPLVRFVLSLRWKNHKKGRRNGVVIHSCIHHECRWKLAFAVVWSAAMHWLSMYAPTYMVRFHIKKKWSVLCIMRRVCKISTMFYILMQYKHDILFSMEEGGWADLQRFSREKISCTRAGWSQSEKRTHIPPKKFALMPHC